MSGWLESGYNVCAENFDHQDAVHATHIPSRFNGRRNTTLQHNSLSPHPRRHVHVPQTASTDKIRRTNIANCSFGVSNPTFICAPAPISPHVIHHPQVHASPYADPRHGMPHRCCSASQQCLVLTGTHCPAIGRELWSQAQAVSARTELMQKLMQKLMLGFRCPAMPTLTMSFAALKRVCAGLSGVKS